MHLDRYRAWAWAKRANLGLAAVLVLASGSLSMGAGFVPRTYSNRASKPSVSGPSNYLTRQYYSMSGGAGGMFDSRSASSVSTVDSQAGGLYGNRMSRFQRRGGGALSSLGGQQTRVPSGGLINSGSLGIRRSYDDLQRIRYSSYVAAGTALTRLGAASQAGGIFGVTREASGTFDGTLRSWKGTVGRYSGGFSASDSPLRSSPGLQANTVPGSLLDPAGGTVGSNVSPLTSQPSGPSAALSVLDHGQGALSLDRDQNGDQEREAERKAVWERRQGYEEKAKQAFKAGEYRVAANALALAEMMARDNPDQLARIKLLLVYAHIANEEDAQAVVDVIWLSSPDRLTGQPRGIRALRNASEIATLYGREGDFLSQDNRIRLRSVSRYDYLALRAMMAWASGKGEQARNSAKESSRQFDDYLKAQKIDLTQLNSMTGGSAVERSSLAAAVWPKYFETMITAATTETAGDAPVPPPASR